MAQLLASAYGLNLSLRFIQLVTFLSSGLGAVQMGNPLPDRYY